MICVSSPSKSASSRCICQHLSLPDEARMEGPDDGDGYCKSVLAAPSVPLLMYVTVSCCRHADRHREKRGGLGTKGSSTHFYIPID